MKIAFRVDASLQMGIGHVMRCLTLADALRAQGAQCHFISRAHPGHLIEVIRQRGHTANGLVGSLQKSKPTSKKTSLPAKDAKQRHPYINVHTEWLGSTWQADAKETVAALSIIQPDWLVVDHYALDQRWEMAMQPYYKKLLVIDDLADRTHHCDLLLDQNVSRQPQDYVRLVSPLCQVLTGPRYALLRPEFATLRPFSLHRRHAHPVLRKLLISMGGVDQANATGQVLQALKTCALPAECSITVIMGLTAPWLESVQELAANMPWPTEVAVNVDDVAQRMAESDLAVGAAGSTSLERCCLGLPTLLVVLAENQRYGANALAAAQAVRLIGDVSDISSQLPLGSLELNNSEHLRQMSLAASVITDGQGVKNVLTAVGAIGA